MEVKKISDTKLTFKKITSTSEEKTITESRQSLKVSLPVTLYNKVCKEKKLQVKVCQNVKSRRITPNNKGRKLTKNIQSTNKQTNSTSNDNISNYVIVDRDYITNTRQVLNSVKEAIQSVEKKIDSMNIPFKTCQHTSHIEQDEKTHHTDNKQETVTIDLDNNLDVCCFEKTPIVKFTEDTMSTEAIACDQNNNSNIIATPSNIPAVENVTQANVSKNPENTESQTANVVADIEKRNYIIRKSGQDWQSFFELTESGSTWMDVVKAALEKERRAKEEVRREAQSNEILKKPRGRPPKALQKTITKSRSNTYLRGTTTSSSNLLKKAALAMESQANQANVPEPHYAARNFLSPPGLGERNILEHQMNMNTLSNQSQHPSMYQQPLQQPSPPIVHHGIPMMQQPPPSCMHHAPPNNPNINPVGYHYTTYTYAHEPPNIQMHPNVRVVTKHRRVTTAIDGAGNLYSRSTYVDMRPIERNRIDYAGVPEYQRMPHVHTNMYRGKTHPVRYHTQHPHMCPNTIAPNVNHQCSNIDGNLYRETSYQAYNVHPNFYHQHGHPMNSNPFGMDNNPY